MGGGLHACIGATCNSAPVILDNALISVYTYYALAIYYIYIYIYTYIMLSAQAYNSELSDACVGCTVYSSHVPTYQYREKHVSNAKVSVKKPFQTQIPQAQAHNHQARNVPVIVVRKTFTASALYVEFSSDSLPCKMVVRLLLLLCLAFVRITAGEILLYCTGLSLVQVPHLVCRHNSTVSMY